LLEIRYLTTRPGEVLALLGPNGAGKTTTIRCVVGLASPTSGSITVDGHDTRRDALKAKMAVGFVPDRAWHYPKVTARKLLRYVASVRKVNDAANRMEALLKMLRGLPCGTALIAPARAEPPRGTTLPRARVTCNLCRGRRTMSERRAPKSSRRKVQEHRDGLRAQGLRPLQIWVPDVRSPAFAAEARRQSAAVAASEHAAADQDFIDSVSVWNDAESR